MSDDKNPIAWPALAEGTAVVARDGSQLGKVAQVVGDEVRDIFSGLAVRVGLLEGDVFVPAELVGEITTEAVRLTIDTDGIQRLSRYEA